MSHHNPEELYSDDAQDLYDQIEEEKQQLAEQQKSIRQLDMDVGEVDCNHGTGSITVDGDVIKVKIHVKSIVPDVVDRVVNGYNWSRQFATGYDTRSKTISFDLHTHIDNICMQQTERGCKVGRQ
jgi:hypothetical protein